MRLLIDATALLLRSAGIKSYTYHWILAMRKMAGEHHIGGYPFLNRFPPLCHDRSTLSSPATYLRLSVLHAANHGMRPLLDALCSRYDVFHASNQVRVAPRRVRLTATIHDMTCWLLPELHTEANVRADLSFARNVLERADGLIAVSESTRQDAIRCLKLKPEKITVIHSGIGDAYFDAGPRDAARVRSKLSLPASYLLSVGTIEPRKNLNRLIDAHAALPADVRQEHPLLVAGPLGWHSEATVERLRRGHPQVRYLGYVAEQDLPGLLAGATAFAYPSLYEGFGFPLAEALAAGCPSVTSCVSSLPEVAGDAALAVDPLSTAELTAALHRLLTTPSLRERLSRAARLRASRFRWEEAARRSIEFFERIAG